MVCIQAAIHAGNLGMNPHLEQAFSVYHLLNKHALVKRIIAKQVVAHCTFMASQSMALQWFKNETIN